MISFTEQQVEQEFSFSLLQCAISVLIAATIGIALWLGLNWKVGLGVGLGVLLLQYILLGKTLFKLIRICKLNKLKFEVYVFYVLFY
jgi:hypothetical protein